MSYLVEERLLPTKAAVSADIARHLQLRQQVGRAVVVAPRSCIVLSTVRRQWMKLVQALQRENARTLDGALRAELSRQLSTMESLRFVSQPPERQPDADIYFLEEEDFTVLPENCRTVYFCTQINQLEKLQRYITQDCVVVKYITKSD